MRALFQPFRINVENVENRSIVSITGVKSKGSFVLGKKLYNSNYGEYMNRLQRRELEGNPSVLKLAQGPERRYNPEVELIANSMCIDFSCQCESFVKNHAGTVGCHK